MQAPIKSQNTRKHLKYIHHDPYKFCYATKLKHFVTMDKLSVEDFLCQIGPDFVKYAMYFERHKFFNVASLRCLKVYEDLDFIFGDILSLGERRQIEFALNELKNVSRDDSACVTEKHEMPSNNDNNAMRKITDNLVDKLQQKEMELSQAEQEMMDLDMPIPEPPPQGPLIYRYVLHSCFI